MKILLVDDDSALVTVFETAFSSNGFDVVTAETAAEGLDKAKTEKPDFILLDQILPDQNGNDVLKTLKATEETKDIPVAILSNFTDTQRMDEAIHAGAVDYILKYQVEPQDVVSKVQTYTREAKANQGV